MGYQTIIIDNPSKLTCLNNHLIIENKEINESVFLGNIKILLINNLETSLSTYLINELIKFKICILICNESKYPYSQIIPIYGTYDCSYKLETQIL